MLSHTNSGVVKVSLSKKDSKTGVKPLANSTNKASQETVIAPAMPQAKADRET